LTADQAPRQPPCQAETTPTIEFESPHLSFSDYQVCLHIARVPIAPELETETLRRRLTSNLTWWPRGARAISKKSQETTGGGDGDRTDPRVDEYERDMLAYAYRDIKARRFHSLIWNEGLLEVVFPKSIRVSSDEPFELQINDADCTCEQGRSRRFSTTAWSTLFKGGFKVIHLALGPPPPPPARSFGSQVLALDNTLNEYDLIKLAKLWEGGERPSPTVVFRYDPPEAVLNYAKSKDPHNPSLEEWTTSTLARLARWADPSHMDEQGQIVCVGTLDLHGTDDQISQWISQIRRVLKDPANLSKMDTEAYDSVVALGGIAQGLLDFRTIDGDELRDVFASDLVSEKLKQHSISGIHKGTLFSISRTSDRTTSWPTGVSPYLGIPQAVAVHNEVQTRQATSYLEKAMRLQTPQECHPQRREKERFPAKLSQVRNLVGKSNELIKTVVPNVFHYPSERDVYDRTHESRGIGTLVGETKEMYDVARQRVEYREKRHAAVAALIALFLGLVGTGEGFFLGRQDIVKGPLVLFIAVGVPALAYATFFYWQRHN
jgi:hypothetical protein